MEDPRHEFQVTNPYVSERDAPGPDSPRGKLPVPHRQVWAALQDGLRNLPRVKETVIWCGEGWKWSWQYSYGDLQIAFLLPSEKGVSGVLVVEDQSLEELMKHEGMRPTMRELVSCSEPKGTTRRCWTPVLDVNTARDFLQSVRALLEIVRNNRS
jgi:hypothetical protein